MVLLMLMSVTVALAGVNKDAQPDKTDDGLGLQIFEKELNVPGEEEFVADEILVKFKPEVGKAKVGKINSKHGSFVRRTSPYTGTRRIAIPEGKTVAEMVKLYQEEDVVEYAEPNHIAYALMTPNDPYYGYQWHLDNAVYGGINMESAWDLSTGSGVTIAIIDTGIAEQATDLAGTCFVAGYDFVNNDYYPHDDNGHGTHVAGTVAQSTNNDLGVAGVAFDACLMPVKVLDSGGRGTDFDVADGIIWATNNGAEVISLSLGGPESTTTKNAVAYAYGEGVTIVAAAGNDGPNGTPGYPAAYDDYVIAVGATRYDETVSYYSTCGGYVDIAAPGGDITVDQNNDGYGDGVLQQTFQKTGQGTQWGYYFMQGTSMATPHVSGVAALLISKGVATTPAEVREALESTAEDKGDPGWDPEYGWGIVDAYAALNYFTAPNVPPVADAGGPYTEMADVTITFDGSGSYDIDGTITNYDWEFGDGTTGTGMTTTYAYETAGTYIANLTVTDDKGLNDTDTVMVTVTEEPAYDEPAYPTMHVASIEMSTDSRIAGRNAFVWAVATVTIFNESGNPVEGATVSGDWSGAMSDTESGLTDASGVVVLNSDKVKDAAGTFTFTVADIVLDEWTYDPDANVETSNSTIIS